MVDLDSLEHSLSATLGFVVDPDLVALGFAVDLDLVALGFTAVPCSIQSYWKLVAIDLVSF